uniref:Uncharacterized protein n=1 Tax=Oryza punctata TaxID=4537 RepID=A0A0E0JJK2_ORYPU
MEANQAQLKTARAEAALLRELVTLTTAALEQTQEFVPKPATSFVLPICRRGSGNRVHRVECRGRRGHADVADIFGNVCPRVLAGFVLSVLRVNRSGRSQSANSVRAELQAFQRQYFGPHGSEIAGEKLRSKLASWLNKPRPMLLLLLKLANFPLAHPKLLRPITMLLRTRLLRIT